MTTKERVMTIRLMEAASRNPTYSKQVGVSAVSQKKPKNKTENNRRTNLCLVYLQPRVK